MNRGHGRALIGGELVYFGSGNLVIELINDFHGKLSVVNFDPDFLSNGFNASQNLVKRYDFNYAVAF